MPLTHKPDPLPSELTYKPEHGVEYPVKNRESWYTLAELPRVRAAHATASDLCYFNFKTRNPREINWYLHHKVGCRSVTRDGKNYMFSDHDRFNKNATTPGIVYLPAVAVVQPTIAPKADELRLDLWAGVGIKGGTMFAVAGIETMEGLVVSLDQPHKRMVLQASINRLGVGWGATVGGCLVVATGVSRPSQLNGFQTGPKDLRHPDFTFTLAENWGGIAKAAGAPKKFGPLIEVMMKIGAKTPSALKSALKTNPDHYGDLVKAGLQFKEAIGTAAEEQNVYLVDIPWGGTGAELSVFYPVANYTALWDSA